MARDNNPLESFLLPIVFFAIFSVARVLTLLGYFGNQQTALGIGGIIFAAFLIFIVGISLMTFNLLRKRALIEMSRAWTFVVASVVLFALAEGVGVISLLAQLAAEYSFILFTTVDWMFFAAFVLMLRGLQLQYKVLRFRKESATLFAGMGKVEVAKGGRDALSDWLGDDLNKYHVVVFAIRGVVPIKMLTARIVEALKPFYSPILALGPTSPTELARDGLKALWVTDIIEEKPQDVVVTPPRALTEISIFMTGATKAPEDARPILVGDFLDGVIPHVPFNTFSSFYSVVAGKFRASGKTAILMIQEDMHEEQMATLVKRHADLLIEMREREEKGKRLEEVRISNHLAKDYSDWKSFNLEGFLAVN